MRHKHDAPGLGEGTGGKHEKRAGQGPDCQDGGPGSRLWETLYCLARSVSDSECAKLTADAAHDFSLAADRWDMVTNHGCARFGWYGPDEEEIQRDLQGYLNWRALQRMLRVMAQTCEAMQRGLAQ